MGVGGGGGGGHCVRMCLSTYVCVCVCVCMMRVNMWIKCYTFSSPADIRRRVTAMFSLLVHDYSTAVVSLLSLQSSRHKFISLCTRAPTHRFKYSWFSVHVSNALRI